MIPFSNETIEIAKMFDTVGKTENLDGIMGNKTWDNYERSKISELLSLINIKEKGNLLIGGVGIGRNLNVYREYGFKNIVGVDISDEMIKKCKDKYPDISIFKEDLCDLKCFKDNQFDTTILIYVLIHIVNDDNLKHAIQEIERVTKNEIIIGQVMEPERVGLHGGWCRVREVYDIIKMFRRKKIDHFLKDFYEIKADDNSWINKISYLIMNEEKNVYRYNKE